MLHGAQGGAERCTRRFAPELISDGRLEVRSVKLFADGALGSRGAALLDDYSDQPGWRGLLLKPEEIWLPMIQEWYEKVGIGL
jgi:predicted amidohydrolase YtcJ